MTIDFHFLKDGPLLHVSSWPAMMASVGHERSSGWPISCYVKATYKVRGGGKEKILMWRYDMQMGLKELTSPLCP